MKTEGRINRTLHEHIAEGRVFHYDCGPPLADRFVKSEWSWDPTKPESALSSKRETPNTQNRPLVTRNS